MLIQPIFKCLFLLPKSFKAKQKLETMRVLLVEDEPHVAGIINKGLTENGFSISVALDGITGLEMATNNSFDVIILDIMLPGLSGMQICKQLRAVKNNTPILFLTALGTTENIVAGLNAGGDDYLLKPFKFIELEARLNTLSRRKQLQISEEEDVQHIDTLRINFKAKLVYVDEVEISLTSTEFRLLEFFVRNKNRVISRMEILEKVWGIDFNMGTNVVDVYVNYLRKKISNSKSNKLIQTVVGMGYIFKV